MIGVTVDAKQLKGAVKECEAARASSYNIRGVLLSANGSLVVRGTDLDTLSPRISVPTQEGAGGPAWQTYKELEALGPAGGEWQAYVDGKALLGLLPAAGSVRLTPEGKGLSVSSGSGRQGRIGGVDPKDWNHIPEVTALTGALVLTEADLHRLLSVVCAASRDLTRPILCGVLLEWQNGQVQSLATDTYRLLSAWADAHLIGSMPAEGKDYPGAPARRRILLPMRAVCALLSHLRDDSDEPCSLTWGESPAVTVILRAGEYVHTTRQIEGQFPNYEKIVPTSSEWSVRVDAKRFGAALEAVRAVAAENANRVCVTIGSESLTLRARNDDGGSAVAVVSCKAFATQWPGEVAFNGALMQSYLAGKSGTVTWEGLANPLTPYTLRQVGDESAPDGAAAYVLMPMQSEASERAVAAEQAEKRAEQDAARAAANEAAKSEAQEQEEAPQPEGPPTYYGIAVEDADNKSAPIVFFVHDKAAIPFGAIPPSYDEEDAARAVLDFATCKRIARDLHETFGVAAVVDPGQGECKYELPEVALGLVPGRYSPFQFQDEVEQALKYWTAQAVKEVAA